jgi:hypothetical protein
VIEINKRIVRPKSGTKFLPTDQCAPSAGKKDEEVGRLLRQPNLPPLLEQFSARHLNFERIEGNSLSALLRF